MEPGILPTHEVMKNILHWWPSALVLSVILYATWVPDPVMAGDIPSIPHLDKLIHAVMLGGLTGALMFDYHRADPASRKLTARVIVVITASAMVFGTIDETVQGLLPIGRPFDFMDLLANLAGCLVAAFTAPPAVRQLFSKGVRRKV